MAAHLVWTEAWISQLEELRYSGLPMLECGDLMGIGYTSVRRQCLKLGLNARLNRGHIRGTVVVAYRKNRVKLRPQDFIQWGEDDTTCMGSEGNSESGTI